MQNEILDENVEPSINCEIRSLLFNHYLLILHLL